MWNNYGMMALSAPLVVTQILAMLNIAPEINEMLFQVVSGMGGLIHTVVYLGLVTYAMILLYTANTASGSLQPLKDATGEIMNIIQGDFVTMTGAAAFSGAIVAANYGNWMAAMEIAKANAAASTSATEEPTAEIESDTIEEDAAVAELLAFSL